MSLAAEVGRIDICDLLLQHGADVNACNNIGSKVEMIVDIYKI